MVRAEGGSAPGMPAMRATITGTAAHGPDCGPGRVEAPDEIVEDGRPTSGPAERRRAA